MSHADLIDRLGGTATVAEKLKVGQTVVANWRNRGIAWQWRPAVVDLAKVEGVKVPDDFLIPTKPKNSFEDKGGPREAGQGDGEAAA